MAGLTSLGSKVGGGGGERMRMKGEGERERMKGEGERENEKEGGGGWRETEAFRRGPLFIFYE